MNIDKHRVHSLKTFVIGDWQHFRGTAILSFGMIPFYSGKRLQDIIFPYGVGPFEKLSLPRQANRKFV